MGGGGTPPLRLDDADRFPGTSRLALRLESRLLRQEDLAEVAGLDLERAYRADDDLWDPWRAEMRCSLLPWFRARADGEYDPDVVDPWLRWAAEAELRDARGDRLFGGYRYLKQQAGYVDGGAELAFTRELAVQYRHRYSVRDGRTLEEAYGLRLEHPCWQFLFTYSRHLRTDEDRDERRYLFTLNLKGLGKVGTLKGVLP